MAFPGRAGARAVGTGKRFVDAFPAGRIGWSGESRGVLIVRQRSGIGKRYVEFPGGRGMSRRRVYRQPGPRLVEGGK